MSKPFTFFAYCGVLWKFLPQQAKHWVRDQIIWPPVMTAIITIVSAGISNKPVDWQLFRTGLLLYLFVFITFGVFQFIKAGWRAYQDPKTTVADRELHILHVSDRFTEMHRESAKRSWEHALETSRAERLQKELNEARVALINANDKIDFLTWPEDRPKLSFHSWGKIKPEFAPGGTDNPMVMARHGFYIANDGGAALEITVESFVINNDFIAIGSTLSRIEANDNGFVPVRIKNEVPLSQWDLDIALEKAWCQKADIKEIDIESKEPLELCVSIIYRDYNHVWYRSKGMLRFFFDYYGKSHIEFSAVQQEKHGVCKPVTRDL